jgi:hypothetical protein
VFFDFMAKYFGNHDTKIPRTWAPDIALMNDFHAYLLKLGVQFTEAEFAENNDWMKTELKKEAIITAFDRDESLKFAAESDPIVQKALDEHNENPANALRSILRQAMDNVRPEGERRFTGEWILFNILEMKFVEGHKVREVASRLALSEADLYRKQRVAIEEVARVILDMERQSQERVTGKEVGQADGA